MAALEAEAAVAAGGEEIEAAGGGGVRIVRNLREALVLLDKHLEGVTIRVESVEVREAPALLHLLEKGERKYSWKLLSVKRTDQLAKIRIGLDTVEFIVLPLLKENANANNITAGRFLGRHAWEIRHHGRKVDGRKGIFYQATYDASEIILDVSNKLVNTEPIAPRDIEGVRAVINSLKPLLVFFADDEPGTGGDGGGGAGGPHQAAPEERSVTTLYEALLLYTEHPPPQDINLVVTSIETRHSPALLQLLLKGEEKYRWNLLAVGRVKRLAKVCTWVETLDLGILPLLENNGLDLTASRLLRRYARYIRRDNRKVDGPGGVLYQAANNLSTLLIAAYDNVVKNGEAIEEGGIAAIRHALENLKALVVVLATNRPV